MRKEKFIVTFYSTNEAYLRKSLVDAGFIPDKIEKANKTKKQKLIAYLDTILSDNGDYTTEQIADAVLREAKTNPDNYIDHTLINKKDEDSSIVVVDVFEYSLTVKRVCELAGI